MKWYKHVSTSLDDPFICELLDEFGADAYMVFFGVLEIYAREYSPESCWKLDEKVSYFRRKLRTSASKFQKILSKIYKWEVSFHDDRVSIYIPKFSDLLDNYTRNTNPKTCNTLASDSQETFQPIKNKEERIKKKEKDNTIPDKSGSSYSDDFEIFWKSYPKRSGSKKAAYENWRKLNGDKPALDLILSAITAQIEWRDNANGKFRPEWKDPERWIKERMWEAELDAEPEQKEAWEI